ncbi:lytic murein transglycosylase [Puniceibacterium sp. IMCC21224]|uniref:lytic murein transglycosylase n=1 Tax=Puniceibacterium sp. IMCC21224 TaxID=1618204 RepID=UPI00065CF717|nr:lytic murein transglycosylase [Puniceibacterium sp. IMCC21224]KMK65812.1 lytic murein transglycosylase [Puniceibacterium sp. IMCC21224]
MVFRFVAAAVAASLMYSGTSGADTVETSTRPLPRPSAETTTPVVPVAVPNPGFDAWVRGFRGRALDAGVSATVFDRAFRTARYNPEVVERDRNQSEFTRSIWDYLDRAASESRVTGGKDALRLYRAVLDRIEAKYGVEKEVVVAIWGMESAYGSFRGDLPIIGSLATLAYDGRRGTFFEQQLVAALKILQNGDTTPENMTGSWAGAMGHTQFIPTSFEALAVDFTGDGRRDIWSDDPTDALASTAAYLARYKWQQGQPWGVEVKLPDGFDYAQARRDNVRLPSEWAKDGIVDMDGKPVADHGAASVLLPAGARGAAFLIFSNFSVIARYNAADAYVIGVGHLSDRIRGGEAIRAEWPRDDPALNFDDRQTLQSLLTARGFDTKGVDGRIGPNSIAAVRAFQKSEGVAPDGYASQSLLARLR